MTSAIFSLIGVVVGGLLTGAVQVFQQRRSDRAQMRAGLRLVSAELRDMENFLAAAEGSAEPPVVWAWPEYRALLARLLDDETWVAVAGAYGEYDLHRSGQARDLDRVYAHVHRAHDELHRRWRTTSR